MNVGTTQAAASKHMPMAKHSSTLVNTKHPCPCLPGKGYTKLVYCGRPKPWHSQFVGTVTCEAA